MSKGTKSTASHLAKFEALGGLANRLAPSLIEDRDQLEQSGHTPALRGREFAALTEALICELYAVLQAK